MTTVYLVHNSQDKAIKMYYTRNGAETYVRYHEFIFGEKLVIKKKEIAE